MKQVRSLLTPPVISIFCAALVVRVIYNVVVAHGYNPQHDSLTYQSIAYGILKLHCYCFPPNTVNLGPPLPVTNHPLSTTDRAPLWPLIIAAIYGLLGEQDRFVRIFLSLVGSATCVLIYCFSRDLFSKRIGLFAGYTAIFYPFLFIYDGWLYTESLYTFFLLAFCYTLYRLLRTPRWQLMGLSGILLGLLSLTRPNGFALLALFLVWLLIIGWTKTLRWRAIIHCGVIVTLLTLALIAPWTIRNYRVTQAFVPVAVGDGKVLIGAYNDNVADPSHQNGFYYGIWQHPIESYPSVWQQFPQDCSGPCEVARDTAYKNAALEWIEGHLDKMPTLLGLHFLNTWQITSQEADLAINKPPKDASLTQYAAIAAVQAMMIVITPIVFALAALGLIVTRNRWRELLFIYFMIALTIAQCILLYGIPRFRAPIEPMLIILASGGVWWLITLLHKPFKEQNGVDFSPTVSYTRTGK